MALSANDCGGHQFDRRRSRSEKPAKTEIEELKIRTAKQAPVRLCAARTPSAAQKCVPTLTALKQKYRSESGGDLKRYERYLPAGGAVEKISKRKNQISNHAFAVIEVIDYLPRVNCQPETLRKFHQSQKLSPHWGKIDRIFFPRNRLWFNARLLSSARVS